VHNAPQSSDVVRRHNHDDVTKPVPRVVDGLFRCIDVISTGVTAIVVIIISAIAIRIAIAFTVARILTDTGIISGVTIATTTAAATCVVSTTVIIITSPSCIA
jgi:hypothetical protein